MVFAENIITTTTKFVKEKQAKYKLIKNYNTQDSLTYKVYEVKYEIDNKPFNIYRIDVYFMMDMSSLLAMNYCTYILPTDSIIYNMKKDADNPLSESTAAFMSEYTGLSSIFYYIDNNINDNNDMNDMYKIYSKADLKFRKFSAEIYTTMARLCNVLKRDGYI
jgi:hypothetical protein